MRIGIMGKGGSGKTTIAALLIKYLSQKHFVIAIDADQNAHLGDALGIEAKGDFASLGSEVKTHILGKREDVKKEHMIATTPPSTHSNFIFATKDDQFIQKHASIQDNIALIQAGAYEETDIGSTCYHGKLEPVEMFYHHLLDIDNNYVVADSTAGMDSLGHSIFMVHDVIIYVVEPTKKSTQVFNAFKEIARKKELRVLLLANKCMSEQDKTFVKEATHEEPIANIPFSEDIRSFEQGDQNALDKFIQENEELLSRIFDQTKTKKDWKKYYNLLLELHKTSGESWYDDYLKHPVSKQYDPEFSYEKVMK